MKTPGSLLTLLGILALGHGLLPGQVPELISFQARVLDDTALANGTISVRFSLFDAPTDGTELYSEVQNLIALDGLISARIGANNPTPGSLFEAFGKGAAYLELEIDGDIQSPRELIVSVPFAFQALSLEGFGAEDFAPVSHLHDGGDIASGTIAEAFIDAGISRDTEVFPTVLANDGVGSGLDADFLQGLGAESFLRSDASDTFGGGVLTIAPGAGLDVRGSLNVGPNSGADSRIDFGGTSENFLWDSNRTTFRLSDELHVEGPLRIDGTTLSTGALSVGTNIPDNDDVIYFDTGTAEAFFWDDNAPGSGEFKLSDDLNVQGGLLVNGAIAAEGNLSVGTTNSDDNDVIYFDSGTDEFLSWNNPFDAFFLSNDIVVQGQLQSYGDLHLGVADGSDNDTLYFDDDEEYLRWEEASSRFVLSDDLEVGGQLIAAGGFASDGALSVGTSVPNDDDYLYFDTGTAEFLFWDDSADRFVLSNDLKVRDNLLIGSSDSNHSIFFFNSGSSTSEYIRWDDAANEFVISNTLHVQTDARIDSTLVVGGPLVLSGFLFMGQADGIQTISFHEDGAAGGEWFEWHNPSDRFRLSDDLEVLGGVEVTGVVNLASALTVGTTLNVGGNAGIQGNTHVTGHLSAGSKNFRIDHPLDPANKYLKHTSVESPDMKTHYDGVVVLEENGEAWVELPEYFEALNRDFRYQLTAIGDPGPNLHVAEEVAGNRFRIAGGVPELKVSWQVTGIRQDVYANAHRTRVEVEKPEGERGTYLHPELIVKSDTEAKR